MKATTINILAWVAIFAALAANTLFDGLDGFATAGNIFGYALICAALAVVINNKIKED